MTTATTTLADFLLARIAEDEAPRVHDGAHEDWCMDPSFRNEDGNCFYCGHPVDPAMAESVARTARVLAECEAKRRIVELHKPWHGRHECPICADGAGLDHGDAVVESLVAPCPTLRLLTLPYADHPDYRPEWRP